MEERKSLSPQGEAMSTGGEDNANASSGGGVTVAVLGPMPMTLGGGTQMNCVNVNFADLLQLRQLEVMQVQGSGGSGLSLLHSNAVAQSSSCQETDGPVEEEEEGLDFAMGGNVEVDESPLKPSINRNKESLKLKLQMRRPINQLVEQGILPSPNTPPAYACQRVKLERARMGDLLKAKIQQRPSRQELVRQHILEETDPRVAPLLAEKQRMLKRARLADSLNDHLIHRPGPLELVKKNILHAPDESIDIAIKEGIVPFKATCEGATPGPPLPTKYICTEDDSSSDVSSPSVNLESVSPEEQSVEGPSSVPSEILPESVIQVENKVAASSSSSIVPAAATAIILQPPPPPPLPPPPPPYSFTIQKDSIPVTTAPVPQNLCFAVPIFSNVTPTTISQSPQQTVILPSASSTPTGICGGGGSSSSSFKSRSSKKLKSKSGSKSLKFHEYKGPPSAHKFSSSNASLEPKRPTESSYDLLLQQQQLFLQWQLEWQHRFPKILLPALSKMSPEEKKAFCSTLQSSSSTFPSSSPNSTLSSHQNISIRPAPAPPTTTTTSPTSVMADGSSLPMQIISSPTNSVLILSSAPPTQSQSVAVAPAPTTLPATSPLISTTNRTNNTNAHGTPSVAQSQSQPAATLVITTPVTTSTTTSVLAPMTNSVKAAVMKLERAESGVESGSVTSTPNKPKLNDWKVSELKAELKKRNLPVSGSKSQLVERLQTLYAKLGREKESSPAKTEVKASEDAKNPQSPQGQPVSASSELKLFITRNPSTAAATATLLNAGALEFLQKSGLLLKTHDVNCDQQKQQQSQSSPTVQVQPTSRSVLQQKIQLKLQQQQQAKTLMNLNTNNNNNSNTTNNNNSPLPSQSHNDSNNAVQKAEPLSNDASVGVNEFRAWVPIVTSADMSGTLSTTVVQAPVEDINKRSNEAWVLKIREAGSPTTTASFENCLANLLSNDTSGQPTPTNNLTNNSNRIQTNSKCDVKSQMVDDVLEILIRNGELPASAANPVDRTPTPTHELQRRPDLKPPPAPPPLPPTTFAITLPTEISFRRLTHPHLSLLPPFTTTSTLENQNHEHGITNSTTTTGERRDSLLGITKDAEAILKISEELAFTSNNCDHHNNSKRKSDEGDDPEYMEMDMDMEGEKKPSSSLLMMNGDSSSIAIDELLTEALEFPMDTEYSDWLESFSSDNTFSSSSGSGSSCNNFNNHHHPHHDNNVRPLLPFMEPRLENNRDPLLSSNNSKTIGPRVIDGCTPNRIGTVPTMGLGSSSSEDNLNFTTDHSGNMLLMMDVDTATNTTSSTTPSSSSSSETDSHLRLGKIKKEQDNANNLNNVNDLWDFSF